MSDNQPEEVGANATQETAEVQVAEAPEVDATGNDVEAAAATDAPE